MAQQYEPLDEIRKNFKLSWRRCPIEPAKIRELTARSDVQGFLQTIGFLLLLAATGTATWLFFDHRMWVGFAVALFLHGTVDSFIASGTHELSHGTVFKTRWLNTFFLYFLALISWFNPRDFKLSHTYHHLYTLHPRADREVVLPTKPSLFVLHWLQLLTLNIVGGKKEPYSFPIAQNVWGMVRMALIGRQGKEWLKAVYEGHEEELRRAANWARVVVLFNAAIIAVTIVFRLWPLALIVTIAPFTANWWRYFVFVPMHTGLKDDVEDFRLCVRSITLDPVSHFIYWRMNWHIEHHMFAAVPCYRLRKMHKTVAGDMPRPRTLFGAWAEMRKIWKQQKTDPTYQFETALPKPRDIKERDKALEAAIGDLAPRALGE
jgi:fatty acid desaturase